MRGRDRGGQEEQDREAAEQPLHDDGAERGDAEPLQPAPRVARATARRPG